MKEFSALYGKKFRSLKGKLRYNVLYSSHSSTGSWTSNTKEVSSIIEEEKVFHFDESATKNLRLKKSIP